MSQNDDFIKWARDFSILKFFVGLVISFKEKLFLFFKILFYFYFFYYSNEFITSVVV